MKKLKQLKSDDKDIDARTKKMERSLFLTQIAIILLLANVIRG